MEVRNKLKTYRHKHEMNQKEFAEFIGISSSAYSNYENQTRQPSLFLALQFAEKLDCTVNDIFYIEP